MYHIIVVFFGKVREEGRSRNFSQTTPWTGNPTKGQLCQMRKIAGAHSPAVHSHSPHIYYLVLSRRLPDHCPLICWRKKVAGEDWGGLERGFSFTLIIEAFLLHEMDLGEGWNGRRRVSDVTPQHAEASCNMACHFYGPSADVSQLHVGSGNTMEGIY